MFQKRIWRYKWLVLAPFEKHLGNVKYAEITGRHEKRYHFGPTDQYPHSPFCISIAYARNTWQGGTKTCSKAKATHLVVRPHLHKELSKPLSNSEQRFRKDMKRVQGCLSSTAKHFTGEMETNSSITQWVGIELILSTADIEQCPDRAYTEWENAISIHCSDDGLFSSA